MFSQNEEEFEEAIVELFQELGYAHIYGPDVIKRDYHNPLYEEELRVSLPIINNNLSNLALEEAISSLKNIELGSLEDRNAIFMHYLQNGVSVRYVEDGVEYSDIVYLVDFKNIDNNSFHVINQWTVIEHEEKRPDVLIFVNGFPLVVVELKSPSREDTDASEAYTQLKNYMDKIPSLFVYNAFCVMSDHALSKAGTITADENRFMSWKTTDGSYENTEYAKFDVLFEGMFEKRRFLDILQNFILFSKGTGRNIKILAAYHQYFAVNKAISSTKSAIGATGKAGVIWHTQGSGKSLSMVFYVNKLQQILNNPTFVILTDMNDLDDQLFAQFNKCSNFIRQTPKQATSRKNLKELLNNRKANGIFFSTMQKFEESDEPLTEREDIIVMADEAHRSQYGLEKRINPDTGEITVGNALKVRQNLPNATFIGFTGTPISAADKNTRSVFGNYIDIYDLTQSEQDGATTRISYESRVVNLKLDEETLQKIDEKYDELAKYAEPYNIGRSKKELSRMESLLGAPETINSLCKDIINHYENNRQYEVTGKAMIVAYSRNIAIKIYNKILELRPEWEKEKIKVVMTSSNKDSEEWHKIIGNKSYKKELSNKFKDDNDPMKIAIVVDMWLTGFDIPSLATMYFYKPMKEHALMQAIARVNRVFEGKEGGLIVDYIGLASALKQAMSDYTGRDQQNYGEMDVDKVALPKFQEKLEICRDLFHGFDYTEFYTGTALERSKLITNGVNFLSDPSKDETKQLFIKEAQLLRKALSLCRSLVNEKEQFEAAYFETVRTVLTRLNKKGMISLGDINKQITQLLEQSIKSGGIINLVPEIKGEYSLFDPEFLKKVASIPERNLVVELLKKLLKEQVRIYKHSNLVQSEKFSQSLEKRINQYINGHLTSEEVIQELIKMAKDMKKRQEAGQKLGLNQEETAFYDAITRPEAIKDFYGNKELIQMTQELTELLRKNRTIDWQKKESSRAKMRMIVKRLLKKYKYPPEGLECAIKTVLKQCELWADNENMTQIN